VKGVELVQFSSPQALAEAAATAWLEELNGLEEGGQGIYSVALSGGRIAGVLFSALSGSPRKTTLLRVPVHFFWADERCVPPANPESNFRLANQGLFGPVGIPVERIHRVKGELAPEVAAAEAERELRLCCGAWERQPVLDLILLGMGEDGHVASLFPGEPESSKNDAAVCRPVTSPKPPPDRVTLGYPTIAAARQVWVLISGPGKEAALKKALEQQSDLPLGWVLRQREKTTIFTDVPLEKAGED
jgi:6-phosphogluconolactonase